MKLPKPVLDRIQNHARDGAPQEVCGLLAGRRGPEGDILVERAFPIRNAHPSPIKEYLLDPQEQLATVLHVEDDLGLEVVGFYHSHPAGPPRLSVTDIAKATWPGTAYVLVWLAPAEGYGCWIWQGPDAGFIQEPLHLA